MMCFDFPGFFLAASSTESLPTTSLALDLRLSLTEVARRLADALLLPADAIVLTGTP